MTQEQLDTKLKIVIAARELFGSKGYEGASVREIATLADVNIAALNYHFSSKEKLFFHVINLGYEETSRALEDYIAAHPEESVEEFAIWSFRYFLDQSNILRSLFKMMLSEMHWEEIETLKKQTDYGPPGSKAFAAAIMREVRVEVSEADMFWAVKMIFSMIVHLALIYSNHFCSVDHKLQPYHTQEVFEEDIRRLVRVVLQDLRQ